MISKQWRERLIYTVMSVFVGWHTLAMAVAPASDASDTAKSLRLLFQPYLTLFTLDHQWAFFAPSVPKGTQLQYVIKDASGESHTFVPSAQGNWFHPGYIWFKDSYEAILDSPDDYTDTFAALFCREHASLRPVSISFLTVEEADFKPADHSNGKHPLDRAFVTMST